MDKKELGLLLVAALIVVALLIFVGVKSPDNTQTNKVVGNAVLSDLQNEACNSADKSNTCYKLEDLDLITKEECCSKLKKCC